MNVAHMQTTRSTRWGALAAGLVLLGAVPSQAAVITVTDCVNDPNIIVQAGTDTTRIEVGAHDLVLACALAPLGGTHKLVLSGTNITLQGPAGTLMASGSGLAIDIAASATFTAVDSAIEAPNGNAAVDVVAGGDILFEGTSVKVGATGSGGDLLLIECTGAAPDCTVTARNSSFKSRELDMYAVGDINLSGVTITTNSPRDRTEIISFNGNVNAGAMALPQQPPASACLNVDPDTTQPNVILGGPESDVLIQAFGYVDLTSIRITVAQNIFVISGAGGGMAGVAAYIDVTAAQIRNDIGKKGEIVMTADETSEVITVNGVLLIDDDESAGVNDVAELNGCEMVPRAGCPNVVGTPATDS